MPKGITRRRLSTGIYQDTYGIAVVYHVAGKPKETRFDLGTPLEKLKRWRKTQLGQVSEMAPRERGTFARDVVRYLKRLKGRPGYKSEKSHFMPWVRLFGKLPRWTINAEKVDLAVARWRMEGYSARTIRHRCRVLESLFHRIDGKRAPTPLDAVILPAKPKPRPVSVSDDTIAAVALELRKREIAGLIRSAKTRARYLLRMTHSQRPIEFMRALPDDVQLDRRLWFVRGAKGSYNTIVPLNAEQLAAWRLCASANAWGTYDSPRFAKTLRAAGWPKGIRPYNLRHSTGFALSARGVDLGDIQGLMGHTSPETTRQFYVPGLIERLAAATQKLEGRFTGEGFAPALPRRLPRQKASA